jgi:hypothetical protein
VRKILDKEFTLDDTKAQFIEKDATKFLAHDIRKIRSDGAAYENMVLSTDFS